MGRSVLLALALVACNGGSMKLENDSQPEWFNDLSPDGETPAILSGEVWCTPGSGSSGDLFFVEVEVFDPQGEDDVADQGGRVIGTWAEDAEDVIFDDEILVCSGGFCQASWRDGIYEPVACASYDRFSFTAIALDRAGNPSDPFPLIWRD
ncbi:MAG: hypothetical protein H6740_15260 [Alphaproteobacteria bacterium]|nr:hypothetical protein [Alphaproteobacteria bacterium]